MACILVCGLLYKEFKLLCFDESFAGSRGFPVIVLDMALMSTVVVISIVGLQAVGLILVVALLIIPAAAARFWTENLWQMMLIAAVLGTLGGMVGAAASALFPKLPSGAMIVLVCAGFFVISMVFGGSRGVLVRSLRRVRVNRSIARQHLLRAIFELREGAAAESSRTVSLSELLPKRSWSRSQLRRAIALAAQRELVTCLGDKVRLTKKGRVEAERLTREHRLWELYLITEADIAPSRVDREADRIEHVLEPEIVAELEAILTGESRRVPESPHDLQPVETESLGSEPLDGGESTAQFGGPL
jgi:manganese/zinc/iron transport system permease protein